MRVITVSVSKHSSGDRSYAHDAWEFLGENDHHWFVRVLTPKSSWNDKPIILLEKKYYDIFDVPKNIADIVIADYRKRYPEIATDSAKYDTKTPPIGGHISIGIDKADGPDKTAYALYAMIPGVGVRELHKHTLGGNEFIKRIPLHEPVFVLRAQDKLAHHFVRQWVAVAVSKGLSPKRAQNAMECADAMEAWKNKKYPD